MGILSGPPPLIPSVAPPPLTPSYEKCRCHREPRLWQPYVDPTPATTRRMVMQPPRKLLDGAEAGRCNSSTMTMQPEEAGGSGWSHGISGWCRSRLLTPQGRDFFLLFSYLINRGKHCRFQYMKTLCLSVRRVPTPPQKMYSVHLWSVWFPLIMFSQYSYQ